ncbi:MAG TPA: response regulator transcription factor [Solirubrobacteraceae bacterium]|nr:response regulator transcription factor [Solirubrobacteraceae bacterium]
MAKKGHNGFGASGADEVSVVVADDHPLFLGALKGTVESHAALRLLGAACDGEEAVELVTLHRPDVAVLDMRMPKLDGREVMGRLREQHPATRVLFISEYIGGEVVLQALTAGAAGYLPKSSTPEQICDAIIRISQGESVLPAEIGTELAGTLRDRRHLGTHLTARELGVLELIAEGESANVIADRLHLAVPTVKSHIQNLYAKLGVNDRGAVVAEAMRRGLIT